MRTPKDGSPVSLVLMLCAVCVALPALSRPRPPAPPLPDRNALCALRFDGSNVLHSLPTAPIALVNVSLVESWSGWSANFEGSGPALLALPCVADDGRTNLAAMSGTISLWVRPASSDLLNPTVTQALFQVGAWSTKGAAAFWSLQYDPHLDTIAFLGLSSGEAKEVLAASVPWQDSTNAWHQVILTWEYSAKVPTRLYVDGALQAEGEPVALVPLAPTLGRHGFCIGSDVTGARRVAEADEVLILGEPKSAEEIAARYKMLAPTAGLGPISPAEDQAVVEKTAAFRAEREAALAAGVASGGMALLSLPCGTGGVVYLTNLVCARTTNDGVTVAFDIAGGSEVPYDIYRTTSLQGSNITNSAWTWLRRGYPCNNYSFTNQPEIHAVYLLGTPADWDGDGLPDAYETLITHTPTNALSALDTDGDGIPDAWELANGSNPTVNDAGGDADGDGISNIQEYLNEQQLLWPREPLGPCSRRTPLVISEIRYQPQTDQFIEIYNSSHLSVKLGGYTMIGRSIAYTFPTDTVIAFQQFLAVGFTNTTATHPEMNHGLHGFHG